MPKIENRPRLWNHQIAAHVKCVTRPAISQAISRGALKVNNDNLIDANDPVNFEYLFQDLKPLIDIVRRGKDASDPDFNPSQKLKEDIKLKQIQAKLKTHEYAKKMGALLDSATVEQKFGEFKNFIVNELLTLPHNVADIITGIVQTTEESPELAVEVELSKQLKRIIENAKRVAQNIKPPEERQYIFLDDGDEVEL